MSPNLHLCKAVIFLSGRGAGGEREIGEVRSTLGTVAGNSISGKRDGKRER